MLIIQLFIFVISLFNNINTFYGSPMNHIYKNIYLGDYRAAENERYLKMYDILSVVNCAAELYNDYKDLKSFELYLHDMPSERIFPIFEQAYDFVKRHLDHNILVHCYMGISRSSSFVVFYLMKENGWDYETCIDFIRQKRPIADPNYGFESQLKEYYYRNILKKHL